MEELSFEEALSRLEEIVKTLEGGDLALDDSLKIFEEGIALSRFCMKRLEEVEKKVEILLKDQNGTLTPQPLKLGNQEGTENWQ